MNAIADFLATYSAVPADELGRAYPQMSDDALITEAKQCYFLLQYGTLERGIDRGPLPPADAKYVLRDLRYAAGELHARARDCAGVDRDRWARMYAAYSSWCSGRAVELAIPSSPDEPWVE